MTRILASFLVALAVSAAALAGTSSAQVLGSSVPDQGQVRVSLVSPQQSAVPGEPVRLAVKLEHRRGWHTYWESPGIGEPTKLVWTLPSGFTAGGIEWPVPTLIHGSDGKVTGHGYEGTVYLPVTVQVPASASGTASFKAKASWLMCELEMCIPGGADLSLDLPVRAGPSAPNPDIAAALAATPEPESARAYSVVTTRSGDTLHLSLTPTGEMRDPHFYSRNEMVWHDVDQMFERKGDRLMADLPIDQYFEGDASKVSGVLAFTDGEGRYRGLAIETPLTAGAPANTAAPFDLVGVLQAVLLAFLGGLILNLMPCVLPILSLKAISLAQLSGVEAGKARTDGLLYTAGVLVSFLVIAAALLIARQSIANLGWGFQLQNPAVVMTLALIMIGVGLNLLGVFEIGGGFTGVGQGLTVPGKRAAAFFTGVLAVVVATPCTAPFMASAIGLAVTQPAPIALAIFASLGLGLAMPYLLISLIPGASRILPKPGRWMLILKQVLAFPMFVTAAWLLWVLGAQAGNNAVGMAMVGVILIGVFAWALSNAGPAWRVLAGVAAALVVGTVAWVAANPAAPAQASEAARDETAYTPEAVTALLTEGKPVFAYFTADWCVSCKVNEASTLNRAETRTFFKDKGVTVVVGDWTNYNQPIADLLAVYKRAGVPMYLYFPAGSKRIEDGRMLPQVLTPGLVKAAVEEAEAANPAAA